MKQPTFLKGIVLGALTGAVFAAATVALASTLPFTLGTTNRVNASSTVTNVKSDGTQNAIASPLITLENLTTGTGATALALRVASGHAPFTTNSATRVPNLNADQLDSLDSTALQRRVGATCGAGSAIRAISATGTVTCQRVGLTTILNAGRLDPDHPKTFTLAQSQKLLVLFSASGYRRPGDGPGLLEYVIGIEDATGNFRSATTEAYTNETNSHKAVLPVSYVESWSSGNGLPAGQYTLSVGAAVGTTWDENDSFRVTVVGLPPGS